MPMKFHIEAVKHNVVRLILMDQDPCTKGWFVKDIMEASEAALSSLGRQMAHRFRAEWETGELKISDQHSDFILGQTKLLSSTVVKLAKHVLLTNKTEPEPLPLTDGQVLMGVLSDVQTGPCIGFWDGEFCLFTLDPSGAVDVMCREEDWDNFVTLCAEYSDYVEGDA